jgi:hypothetical protein
VSIHLKHAVSCSLCTNFRPDTIGFGQGLGRCQAYEDYRAKGPSESAKRDALLRLGQVPDERGMVMEMFYPGWGVIDRLCEKFKEKAE